MNLTYINKNSYRIICDEKGVVGACYVDTTTDIYNEKVFLVSTLSSVQIPLDKMKKVVESLN